MGGDYRAEKRVMQRYAGKALRQPSPSVADLVAGIYRVDATHEHGCISALVLAYDAAHALEVLTARYGGPFLISTATETSGVDVFSDAGARQSLLAGESDAEWQARQERYVLWRAQP